MKKYSRKLFWICMDLFFINISMALSIVLRFGRDWGENIYQYRFAFIYLSLLYLVFAFMFRLYDRVWRYISINDLFLIAGTVTSAVIVCILYYNIAMGIYFPWTVKALVWFISLALIAGSRLVWRLYWERRNPYKRKDERILIVGAGDAGDVICREIEKRKDLGQMVGFIDDDIGKVGSIIRNKKVLGIIDDINGIINREKIDVVIIAIPSARGSEIRRIISKINNKDVKIKTVPGLYELINEKVNISRIRNVGVEDLLNRDSINLNIEEISEYIKGKRVMVTGGAGSIGEEISIQVGKFSPGELMILDHNENGLFYTEKKIRKECPDLKLEIMMADIRNKEKMENIFESFRPEVVFHAAAHKHVPMMEYHPDEAVSNNIVGTKNLVEIADKWGVNDFVMISTDKAINPTSVMGASKQVAEMIVKMYAKKSKTHFVAVRFGNVLESNGSVIPTFKRQIAEGGPITVTDKEIKRYFMTVSEASQLVIQAGGLGIKEAVFVLDMGELVKIIDLARNLIQLSGLIPDEDIKIEFIGLRPGEKLFEELLTEKERSRVLGDSGHERIFIAQTEEVDKGKLEKNIEELRVLAKEMDAEGVVRKLQEVVSTYEPNRGMLN
ncbi:MAG: nucleoside-diphosphate sugar epimerase/dehydratase [Candidatus Caldatribacteriota bacterium]|nr:nucleoside-diphosphate sugar epimerase/dehydratase [Candidatus Caldatribacteriota bacterium]